MLLFKRIIACLSACVIVTGSVSLSVYADKDTNIDNMEFATDYTIVDMDKYQEYLDSLTHEQRQIINAKEQMAADIESMPSNGTNAAGRAALIGLPGSFTIYGQETPTYCVPACIKSVLMYTTGSSPTQSSIYSETNMDFTQIPLYVNSRQEKCLYTINNNLSQSNLTGFIKVDITQYRVPTFLVLKTTKPAWYYQTSGHCVLSNGIYDDRSTILIADPIGKYAPDCPAFYEKDASDVYNAASLIFW